MHDSFIAIPRCYKDVCVNSSFCCTARLGNSLPIECFPLTFDLNDFKSRINKHLKRMLKKSDLYGICFDESLNDVTQSCQMDVLIRYFDSADRKVKI